MCGLTAPPVTTWCRLTSSVLQGGVTLLHIYRFGLLMVGLALVVSGCGAPGTVQASSPAGTETPAPAGSAQAQTPEPGVEMQRVPASGPGAAGTPAGQGPSEEQLKLLASLKSQGVAPDLSGGPWLNSEPLKLSDLKGKVILVEFWTFGCINCQHVIPSVRSWYNTYKDQGLVVIGVHTPEFDYEKDLSNVKAGLSRLDVPYPVVLDNDWTTWHAYRNRYWPAFYLVDKAGDIRYVHAGEGDYDRTEAVIQALLAENRS
jgi:thiol-disulfide isomerase/thioredoxin